MKLSLAVIDGDILLHEAVRLSTTEVDWGDGNQTSESFNLSEAVSRLTDEVDRILQRLEVRTVLFALSCPSRRYWRHDVLPTYKAGRRAHSSGLLDLRGYAEEKFPTVSRTSLEADDILGILGTAPAGLRLQIPGSGPYALPSIDRRVICSTDKDLKQIPGLLYNPRRDTLEEVTEAEGDRFHLWQTLVGDSTDGYSGCPGIGPKRAEAYLLGGWRGVRRAFVEKGLTEDDALQQARVAKILRYEDIDRETKEVRLWEPSKD